MTQLLFSLFALLDVAGALSMVVNVRNTVAAALSLVVTMISLGGIFVLLEAHLVAVIQIMVYAGAIVVVFLFVVMLLNLRQDVFGPSRQRLTKALGAVAGVWLVYRLLALLEDRLPPSQPLPDGFGGYRDVGMALFTDFLLPFEVTSLLLLAAIVGAIVLAKRRLD